MLNDTMGFGLLRWAALGLVYTASPMALTKPGLAQNVITPDATLGSEASQVIPVPLLPTVDLIEGGAIRGQNLFHSFEQFNVGEGSGAYFITPSADILNIFARITGSDTSQILGILGAQRTDFSTSNASLFLMNPNGIIFGERSSLDLGGSFIATTANSIGFINGDIFSATEPNLPDTLLNINPSALFFNQIQGAAIENRSRFPAGFDLIGSSLFGLRVPDGQSLALLGGDINVDGGGLVALGGHIELGGLNDAGIIEFSVEQDQYQFFFPETILKSNVSLDNSAGIYVVAEGPLSSFRPQRGQQSRRGTS